MAWSCYLACTWLHTQLSCFDVAWVICMLPWPRVLPQVLAGWQATSLGLAKSASPFAACSSRPRQSQTALSQLLTLQGCLAQSQPDCACAPVHGQAGQRTRCVRVTGLQHTSHQSRLCSGQTWGRGAGALAGAVAVLATATTFLAIGKTNNQAMEGQEYVRYPLQVHAHGQGPRGAMLRPDGSLSATA